MRQYALIALAAMIITWVLSLAVYKFALRFKLYPPIRDRDMHSRPTPRLGGVAMFFGVAAAMTIASFNPFFGVIFDEPGPILAILGATLLIVVLGIIDDLVDLDWMIKLAGQFLAAGLIAWLGVQIYSLPIAGRTVGSSWMSFILTVLTIVLVMNAVNFIDGLDGLVGGVALIANGVFFVYGYLLVRTVSQYNYFNLSLLISAVLLGVCAGFLPLNWHPAKMFMGDAGALLVGLLMATSAISITGQIDPSAVESGDGQGLGGSQLVGAFIPLLLPITILVVPLVDFSLAVFRRLRAGKSPFSADRLHLHHRLIDMGHSELHAVLIFYAWTVVISVPCLFLFLFDSYWYALVFFLAGVIACTVATFAPLGRRKRHEVVSQLTPEDETSAEQRGHDPLDDAVPDNHSHGAASAPRSEGPSA
ncbi:MraY family glycosyltransferase [Paramicrobacterium agarici]|uniref:UDP-GlcNAc:undecaprenyl-phosphate GlcNAc-1-phosphate transferase n=1 Tax=Paramicrobacterium agarici TaxID=630514 RepID=A0A2A9DYB5_9MICO|nr:MraY family glycosyltransferase [Microbacterium agarici]PFG30930.1 UDP-GlcNAc:undecaprenyl-phosphate GlcNAc-1-phosphate transferase [Microbacterium agarici]TQO23994.1 UDP-GlcNAc:undecaprenyl-phosphate GlcNAc-1-phosphate transferase [Microbacterium agarici]